MRGVKSAALKAPGPSGTRPEHISELIGIRRKRTANKLLRSLGALLDQIEQGSLSENSRWITRSRSIFVGKKAGKDPRPLKIGEVLRATAAKRLLRRNAPKLRPIFVKMY